MRIAVIGTGRVGTALALAWRRAGHEPAVASHGEGTQRNHETFLPDVPLVAASRAARDADVVVLGVTDALIEAVCAELASDGVLSEDQVVAHLSGATPLAALDAARDAGARRLSLHPLQTFPTVEAAVRRLAGSAMAVTADDEATAQLGERLAADAGCRPFRLADGSKPLYHAAAVLASNAVVAVLGEAAEVFAQAGVDDPEVFLPLVRASIENVGAMGPGSALTGPVVRGDSATVERNLAALAEHGQGSVQAYVSLARLTLDLASRSGRLSEEGRKQIEEVLARWST